MLKTHDILNKLLVNVLEGLYNKHVPHGQVLATKEVMKIMFFFVLSVSN